MKRTKPGRGAIGLGVCVHAASIGCGDIGDAELPLPLDDDRARQAPPQEFRPARDAVRPQAVLNLALTAPPREGAPAEQETCPLAFDAQLPDASARSTLVGGQGPRVVAGGSEPIACRVRPRLFDEGVFELDLGVQHERLPMLRAIGQLGPTRSGRLAGETRSPRRVSPNVEEAPSAECPIGPGSTRPSQRSGGGEPGTNLGHEVLALSVEAPGGSSFRVTCTIESTEVLGGAVWFHTLGCGTLETEGGSADCAIELAAIFERCER